VQDEWAPLDYFSEMLDNFEKTDNPYGVTANKRVGWQKGLGIKDALAEKVEWLLFVGDDYSSFDPLKGRIQAVAKVLQKAGVDFGTLGEKEVSSGSALLMIGDRDYFETFADANMSLFEEAGIMKIVTADPHAATVLKEEYTKALDLEVVTFAEMAAKLIKDGALKPSKQVKVKAAYHDPCRLGRRQDIFDPPRDILEAIPGLELVEFERARKNALCCGGGGSVFFWEPEFAQWVAKERLFEAEYVGAEAIVTACPICVRIFEDAVKAGKSKLKIYDLAEILEQAL
jgi:Fe-S oxidoreductase